MRIKKPITFETNFAIAILVKCGHNQTVHVLIRLKADYADKCFEFLFVNEAIVLPEMMIKR